MPLTNKRKAELEIERRLQEVEEFSSLANWERSARGNRWRTWAGYTLTIFRRKDGWYGWCRGDASGPSYSQGGFETEEEAIADIAYLLEIGSEVDEWEIP